MSEIEFLKEIKRLSNGKLGKDIVISGDAQIVLVNLLKIYALATNRLSQLSNPTKEKERSHYDAVEYGKLHGKS